MAEAEAFGLPHAAGSNNALRSALINKQINQI
jgi:hypothetical protein